MPRPLSWWAGGVAIGGLWAEMQFPILTNLPCRTLHGGRNSTSEVPPYSRGSASIQTWSITELNLFWQRGVAEC